MKRYERVEDKAFYESRFRLQFVDAVVRFGAQKPDGLTHRNRASRSCSK
jgi:hypothetical protein